MASERSPWARPEGDSQAEPSVSYPDTAIPAVKKVDADLRDAHAGEVIHSSEPAYDHGTVGGQRQGNVENIHGVHDVNKTMMRWFAGTAAVIAVIGIIIVAVMTFTGDSGRSDIFDHSVDDSVSAIPDLARECPPPPDGPSRGSGSIPPTPPGPRTTDPDAGISYAAYGTPWMPWAHAWSGGTLKVTYRVGQHFVTEAGPQGHGYYASILSGSIPAAVNDSMMLDVECVGRLVAADVRAEYYYQPTTIETMTDERRVVGGLSAWVTTFRLRFHHQGLKATSELVAVVLLDVGRPEAAVLYVSIPDTHREWDTVVNEVIDSIRPT